MDCDKVRWYMVAPSTTRQPLIKSWGGYVLGHVRVEVEEHIVEVQRFECNAVGPHVWIRDGVG